MHVTLTSI